MAVVLRNRPPEILVLIESLAWNLNIPAGERGGGHTNTENSVEFSFERPSLRLSTQRKSWS